MRTYLEVYVWHYPNNLKSILQSKNVSGSREDKGRPFRGGESRIYEVDPSLTCLPQGESLQPDGDIEQPGGGGVLQDLDGRALWRHCWHSGTLHPLRLCLLWDLCCCALVACTLEGRKLIKVNGIKY